ncbi:F-box domain - like 10 [Theobroma cacao]|nr:F-box domain - like 10 [Theobroma cacao]
MQFTLPPALPEGCIANILSFTSPLDACRSALVSPTFRSAASSDAVWERFLPPDYQDIISKSSLKLSSLDSLSKKDLVFHLCHHPVILNNGSLTASEEAADLKVGETRADLQASRGDVKERMLAMQPSGNVGGGEDAKILLPTPACCVE